MKPAVISLSQHLLPPSLSMQPAVVADFNGDGLNDIIIVTADGIYG